MTNVMDITPLCLQDGIIVPRRHYIGAKKMNILLLCVYIDYRCLEPHSYSIPSLYMQSEWTELKDNTWYKDTDTSPLERTMPDLTDYDMVVVDMHNVDQIGIGVLYDMSEELAERIAAGGILVCFVDSPKIVVVPWLTDEIGSLDWLPITANARDRTGERFNIVKGSKFEPLLRRCLKGTKWKCDFQPTEPPKSEPLAINRNHRPVALYCKYGGGHIVLLPHGSKQDEFLHEFMREIIPEIAPQLVASRITEPEPPWLHDWLAKIPGIQDITSEISETEQQMKKLETKRDALISRRQELERWGDLLWQTGEQILEERVREALKLLGFNALKKYGIDVVVEDDHGVLYAEVEGTIKGIEVDKARKLLEDISKADDPANVRGAIIGNPFRLEQPEKRPPGQHRLFCREVEEAAEKYGWVLMTTQELFEFIVRHLIGDTLAAQELRARFLGEAKKGNK